MSPIVLLVLFTILTVLVLTCMGLSYLSAGLNGLAYNDENKQHRYYANPLLNCQSKYFHYKPAGAVILTRKKWQQIETNMAYAIRDAEEAARKKGYSEALAAVEARVKLKQAEHSPSDPYKVFGLAHGATLVEVEKVYHALNELYKPKEFAKYGDEFVKLAALKRKRIQKAYNIIHATHGAT